MLRPLGLFVGAWDVRSDSGRQAIALALLAAIALGCSGDIKAGPTIGPAAIELVAGDQQVAAAGTPVVVPPQVRVMGENGAPLADAIVKFALLGGRSLTQDEVHTSPEGLASTGWTLGRLAGGNTLTATVVGLAGSMVQFIATGIPGPAAKLGVATAVPTSAANDLPFVPQPVFQLQDDFDNLIIGQPITVEVSIVSGPAGAVLIGSTATADQQGQINFTGLALKGAAGQYTLSFQSPSLPAIGASVRIDAGNPARLVILTQPPDSAFSGVDPFPPAGAWFEIVDDNDNPVSRPGIIAAASVASGGGTLGGTRLNDEQPGWYRAVHRPEPGRCPGPPHLALLCGGTGQRCLQCHPAQTDTSVSADHAAGRWPIG